MPNAQQLNSKSSNFLDYAREHRGRTLAIICGGAVAIFAIIFLGIYSIFRTEESTVNYDPEDALVPIFEHRYLLETPLGLNLSNTAFLDIGNIIINNDEIDSAPTENTTGNNFYTVNLEEDSYQILDKTTTPTYKTDLKISDDRTYTIYIRTDNLTYMTIILNRTDTNTVPDHVFVHTNLEGEEQENLLKTVDDWGNSLKLIDPVVETSDLSLSNNF